MSATKPAGSVASDGDDRRRELQAFDDTRAGVKGLVDAGITSISSIFHHPPDLLDSVSATDDAVSIPVIDLSAAPREEVVARVKAAAETAGFFQVVNHGVAGDVMAGMLAAVRRFNEEPTEAKMLYYTRDRAHKVRFNSNLTSSSRRRPTGGTPSSATWRRSSRGRSPEELPEALSVTYSTRDPWLLLHLNP
ncbi:hypothetical protein EJB05_45743, partial [Eragrostis curvula]